MLKLFDPNERKTKKVKHKSSLEDITEGDIILIFDRRLLVTNIDHDYVQTLVRSEDGNISLLQIALENYVFPKIGTKKLIKKVLLDYREYNKNHKDHVTADHMLIEVGL